MWACTESVAHPEFQPCAGNRTAEPLWNLWTLPMPRKRGRWQSLLEQGLLKPPASTSWISLREYKSRENPKWCSKTMPEQKLQLWQAMWWKPKGTSPQCLFKSSAVFRGLPSHWLLAWFLLPYGTLAVSKKGVVGVDPFDDHGTW